MSENNVILSKYFCYVSLHLELKTEPAKHATQPVVKFTQYYHAKLVSSLDEYVFLLSHILFDMPDKLLKLFACYQNPIKIKYQSFFGRYTCINHHKTEIKRCLIQ